MSRRLTDKKRPRSQRSPLPRGISLLNDTDSAGAKRERYRVRVQWEGKQYNEGIYGTRQDAIAALRVAQGAIALGTYVPRSERRQRRREAEAQQQEKAVTVAQWASDWLERLADGRTKDGKPRAAGTITSYRSTLNVHVLPALGDMRLVDVRSTDVSRVLASTGAGPGAYNDALRTMRAMFREAVRLGVGGLTSTPVDAPERPSQLSRVSAGKRTLEPEEVAALAAAMPPELSLAILLATWCALRQGELLGLQRGDFKHLDAPGEAVVEVCRQWNSKTNPPAYTDPKMEKTRVVAIPPVLVPAIVAHLERYTPAGQEAAVFPSPRGYHQPISHNSLNRRWKEARQKVLGRNFRFHDLRGVGLSYFAEAGATMEETMTRGGHSDIDAAQRYQHARDTRQHQLVAQLPITLPDEREALPEG